MPAASGLATAVTTQPGCGWPATPAGSWIAITEGSSGNGSGAVTLSVTENWDAPREGIVIVRWPTPTEGQNLRVRQAGCFYAVRNDAFTFGSAGGSGTFNVIQQSEPIACGGPLQNACLRTAMSDVPWITVTSSMPRVGDDPVQFVVPRTAALRPGMAACIPAFTAAEIGHNRAGGCS